MISARSALLIDTNILLRLMNPRDDQHQLAAVPFANSNPPTAIFISRFRM
jgi:predicted nucleic-acid-binding protein